MGAALRLGELRIDVVRKDIKNVHLSVHPPNGRTRIAAPRHLSDDAVRAFAISKLGWIRKQQRKLQEQERETLREYLDRETHYVWVSAACYASSSTMPRRSWSGVSTG